ncbi:TetR family transcriptional regulator [Baekduia soli]|uniref:TetR family transcriptional regulator n=1 Tax=Baekduia soli TaxID=496014 RepID=A0A5B8U140_9ACTN|nr:TetR/AcrR family transcriptional regulator [Baekduia soli]QEC46545.1 TetR family transcriptional regulator [Baekduia soli]
MTARPVRGEARRELILDAAIRVLGHEGPGMLTHRRVAAAAGLPLAATTYWFASKEELLVSAYRRAADRDIARVRAVALAHERDGLDVADALADLVASELQDGRSALIACFTMSLEAARRPQLRDIEAEWTEAYVEAISAMLVAAGSPQPRIDAEVLTAALDGLLLAHLARGGGSTDARDAVLPHLRRLVGALTAG